MAIDVNKVYTTVLSILNKKGSGYMTPDNFNKIAPVAQIELLDRAFYEYNQAVAKQTSGRGAQGYGDIPRKIMDKLDPFCDFTNLTVESSGYFNVPNYPISNIYATLSLTTTDTLTDIERVEKSKLPFLFSSKLTAPSTTFPMYYYSADRLYVFPDTITSVRLYYVGRPADPIWNSTADTTSFGTPIYTYDSLTSSNFRLHSSDEPDLILSILRHFGVTIKDPLVIQTAMQEEQSTTQLEQ
jgi:hypothetical protein|tara:strand:+ start:1294 stop:2016 length:723 start_codon:yes stop_codon:yes gene_type:complete